MNECIASRAKRIEIIVGKSNLAFNFLVGIIVTSYLKLKKTKARGKETLIVTIPSSCDCDQYLGREHSLGRLFWNLSLSLQ
jgi:hypothetical protein